MDADGDYSDKTTLSYAAIFGIRDDLDLKGTEYNWLSSIVSANNHNERGQRMLTFGGPVVLFRIPSLGSSYESPIAKAAGWEVSGLSDLSLGILSHASSYGEELLLSRCSSSPSWCCGGLL